MEQLRIPAAFMRGGTSKALVFHRKHLPADREDWAPIFLAALGSPDPNGRQLDGMGGGLSSLSKVCIIEPSERDEADVEYTFGQVEVREARVDYAGNCGSMSAAIGPFAVDEGLVPAPRDGEATVRIHNTNTDRMIVSHFPVRNGVAAVAGSFGLDGVAGSGAPIRLDFLAPGGASTGRLLPTSNVRDVIDVPGIGEIAFSFIDASNPVMFVTPESVGATGAELPAEIESAPGLLQRLETIRRHVSVAIGAAPDVAGAARVSMPRIAYVARMTEAKTLSGRVLGRSDADIMIRMIARGLPNRAVPVTTALCLAVACRLPGTIPHSLLGDAASQDIRVAHPSGVWTVSAKVAETADGYVADHAAIYLTARRLFQGEVFVPAERVEQLQHQNGMAHA